MLCLVSGILNVVMLSVLMLSVFMLNVFIRSITMLSITLQCHYSECHYAECLYAERLYAECHYTECNYAECCGAASILNFLYVLCLSYKSIISFKRDKHSSLSLPEHQQRTEKFVNVANILHFPNYDVFYVESYLEQHRYSNEHTIVTINEV
jgi:hypothetical protein